MTDARSEKPFMESRKSGFMRESDANRFALKFKNRFDETSNRHLNSTKILKAGLPEVNLKEVKVGQAAQVVGFLNRDDAVKKIEAMGLRKGKRITVLRKLGRGILVKMNNSRIVITSDIAKNIEVK